MAIESISLSLPTLEQASSQKIESSTSIENNPISNVNFGNILKDALDRMNVEQINSSEKIRKVELGESDDLVGAMISSQKASLNFSMLVQIRNKVMSGFEDIMRMPV